MTRAVFNPLVAGKYRQLLVEIRQDIFLFEQICERDKATDTGEVWELLHRWSNQITKLLVEYQA